jgi:Domain of unknown function (DUF3597)
MSIFTRIKDAIFGSKANAAPAPQARRESPPAPKSGTATPPSTPARPTAAPSTAPAAPAMAEVDVQAVLQAMAAKNSQKLNWRTSIVDLMKLLEIDSSLENRKELAKELGYKEDTTDSARMNIWLHKRVMQELARNGGKVPAELTD